MELKCVLLVVRKLKSFNKVHFLKSDLIIVYLLFGFFSAIQDFKRMHPDPYNSTLYRATVESSTPMLFVQTFTRKEVIPIYHVSTFNEEHDVTAYDDDDDEEENEENDDLVWIIFSRLSSRENLICCFSGPFGSSISQQRVLRSWKGKEASTS